MNFYLSPCFKTWVRSHRIQTTMQNTMLTISNIMQNLSKPDCKTPLIHLYLISSLPVKSLPFKVTFATCIEEQDCNWQMVADKFVLRGKCWPTLVVGIFFLTLERISKLYSVLRECGRDRRINSAFSTDREISYSSFYSYSSVKVTTSVVKASGGEQLQ